MRETGLNFDKRKDYDWIKKETTEGGYAGFYLKCINAADVGIYKKLVDIDKDLGTELSLQLYRCLRWTTRLDIIKV